nr:DUF2797 domain-containing protein [Azomonas macrocytogenes]
MRCWARPYVWNIWERFISLAFEKTPVVEGSLLGIKGQYLLLDTGVINIRKYTGYQVVANCVP